jgi:hypothetical protein
VAKKFEFSKKLHLKPIKYVQTGSGAYLASKALSLVNIKFLETKLGKQINGVK